MEDICILCTDHLASVTFSQCSHRQYCQDCYQKVLGYDESRQNCPICRGPIAEVRNTRQLQLRETTLNDNLDAGYPFGCRLFGQDPILSNELALRAVRQAMDAVQASRLSISHLKRALRTRLTMEQYQFVFVELIKHEDLHGMLKQLDNRKFEKKFTVKTVQEMVVRIIESSDKKAIAVRAAVATVGSFVWDVATNTITSAGDITAAGVGACAVSNVIMFALFSAIEVYRWAKKDLTGTETVKNIGEHLAGALAGCAGNLAGWQAGMYVGTLVSSGVPGIGNLIGAVIGGLIGGVLIDAGARWLYRKCFPGRRTEWIEREEQSESPLTAEEIAKKAADKFGVNLDQDSFEEAQARFRRRLLNNHPDKHPDVSVEERQKLTAETTDILACWQIVRAYFSDRKAIDEDCEEGFIQACVLRVKETATNQWKIVRTFFETIHLDSRLDDETERLEVVRFYV